MRIKELNVCNANKAFPGTRKIIINFSEYEEKYENVEWTNVFQYGHTEKKEP